MVDLQFVTLNFTRKSMVDLSLLRYIGYKINLHNMTLQYDSMRFDILAFLLLNQQYNQLVNVLSHKPDHSEFLFSGIVPVLSFPLATLLSYSPCFIVGNYDS